ANEAIEAAGRLGGDARNVAVLAVTSADRLNAGWHGAQRGRARGDRSATCHIETLLADLPRHAGLVTLLHGHPATPRPPPGPPRPPGLAPVLAAPPAPPGWLGGVRGHRAITLGVEHFGQTGRAADLYAHYGIDAAAITTAAQSFFGAAR